MRVFLGAHAVRHLAVRIPAPRLLHNATAAFERFNLTRNLILQRMQGTMEGVHILDLGLGPQFRRIVARHADVDIAAHVALLQVAVAHVGIEQNLLQRHEIGHRLGRGMHIGIRDDLHQRHARAVEVHPTRLPKMHALADILLKMNPRQRYPPRRLTLQRDVDPAPLAERLVELRDLVVLGHVGIEIALAVKLTVERNLTPQHQPRTYRQLDRAPVHDRHGARVAQADRTDMRVGWCPEPRAAGTEHLRLRAQLHMRLEAYRGNPTHAPASACS